MTRPNVPEQACLSFAASIQDRFDEYHREHPEVYSALVRFSRDALRSGRKLIGIRMLWERMRWYMYIERADDDFKLNDHFTSRYARMIMTNEPDLEGIFEIRSLRA